MSRIAVIGSGISGMSAAWLLSRKHEVWLFEREDRLGGHTHTHTVETSRGPRAIDTGFIVHNDRTYPNLIRLFQELGVERQRSDMSFGVSDRATGTEYSSRGIGGFFATRRNLLRLAHYRFFAELQRFNRESTRLMEQGVALDVTLAEYLRRHNFSEEFTRLYLYPMASSVWSTSLDQIGEFPAATLLRFFHNHGFLTVNGHPQWYVLRGGSSSYIAPLTAPYKDRIVLDARIQAVCAHEKGATLAFEDAPALHFDEIVLACHGPQALALLAEPTHAEQEVLGSFRTSRNTATLHTDERLLPRSQAARAAWNYHLGAQSNLPTLTYSMNRLQSLDTEEEYCVTLNDGGSIRQETVLREIVYHHPLYTLEAVRAQQQWAKVSGVRHLHFCGAYWFYGFHEDGFHSAIRVAESLGVRW